MSTNTEIPSSPVKIPADVILYDAQGNVVTVNSDGSLDVNVVSGGSSGITKSSETEIFDEEDIDDTADHNSTEFDCSAYDHLILKFETTKNGSPTDMRLFAEFENTPGNWFPVTEKFWTDCRIAGTQVSGTHRETLLIPMSDSNFRLRIAGSGTSGSNYFTVSAWIRGVYG
ncbi:MAG: hypothetical protein ACPG5Z_00350 [Pseudoalteromonas sp.]